MLTCPWSWKTLSWVKRGQNNSYAWRFLSASTLSPPQTCTTCLQRTTAQVVLPGRECTGLFSDHILMIFAFILIYPLGMRWVKSLGTGKVNAYAKSSEGTFLLGLLNWSMRKLAIASKNRNLNQGVAKVKKGQDDENNEFILCSQIESWKIKFLSLRRR